MKAPRLRGRLQWPFRSPFALATIAALAACAGPAPDTAHRFTIVEEDGLTVARTTGGPRYEGDLFVYEKVLEILPDLDRPEALFAFPTSGDLDDDGNLYVADANNNRIAVFDSGGNWLRNIGRQGEGPGEYQTPTRVEYVDGRVYIPDYRKRGVHVFQPNGEFIEYIAWPDIPRVGNTAPEVWPSPTGGWVVRLLASSDMAARLEGRAPGPEISDRTEMRVFDEEGTERVRVTGDWVKTGELREAVVGGRQRTYEVPVYFAPRPWGGYVPGRGMWMTSGAEPTIHWYDLNGNPVGRWEVEMPAAPVTEGDRATIQANLDRQLQEALNPPDGRERPNADFARLRAENAVYADRKPFWGIPLPDDRGFFMISEEPSNRSGGGPPDDFTVLVFSPEGEYLGKTKLPEPGTFSRGHLIAIATDPESEERYPVVYRIRPAVDGLDYR